MVFGKFAQAGFLGAAFAMPVAFTAMAHPSALVSAITAPGPGSSVQSPVAVSYSLEKPGTSGATPWSGNGSGHHHAMHAFLVIDQPVPAPGSAMQPDADHVAFPGGKMLLSVPLAAGHHALQVVFVNRKGQVSTHLAPSAPVSISVQ